MLTPLGIVAFVLALRAIRRRRARTRVRRLYIRSILRNRMVQGELSLVEELRESDPYYHHRYFRMKKETFNKIYEAIKDQIQTEPNHVCPIGPMTRLALTLRYLATGNSQVSLAMNYRVSPSSVSVIVRQVLTAITKSMSEYLRKPEEEDWKRVEKEFHHRWNFPQCVGAIDGKHIRIKKPPGSGSQYFNYKGFYSVVLLAVVDASRKFLLYDCGASGSCSDGGVLQNSKIGQKLESRKYKFPAPEIHDDGKILSPVILGDEGFPLKSYLLKPYPSRGLELPEKIFNYRLSRARMIVEDAFGLLAQRWRIFLTTIEGNLELATEHDSDRPADLNLTPLEPQRCNNATSDAFKLRDDFRNFFMTEEGQVAWQHERVIRRV